MPDTDHTPATDDDVALSPQAAQQLIADGARVIDVRSAESRAGRAQIPGAEWIDAKSQIRTGDASPLIDAVADDGRPVVVVCNSGGTCSLAARLLHERGIDAHFVEGGITAWQEQGLEVEPDEAAGS